MPLLVEHTAVERGKDRRARPTPIISKFTFTGRRYGGRRSNDKHNYYADHLGVKTWAVIGLVILLSVIDSLFTVYFLDHGLQEMNPLMALATARGISVFMAVKYLFTAAGILLLAFHKTFFLVKPLIALIIILYVLLNSYHLWLFLNPSQVNANFHPIFVDLPARKV